MSLLTSFNSGVSALKASQAGLNTTAHNLANTKTPGYTRQQNITADMTYKRYKVTTKGIMQIGYGTAVKAVRQNRDMFLDKEYRLDVSRQNFYDRLYDTVNEIEDVFGEMEGVEFQYSMENIWNALQDLSRNPDVIVDRQLFISECGAFAENASNVYKALINYQTGLNTEINKQVDTINKIGDRIAELNDKIAYAESSGLENANDYRDERNLLMDRLAEITYYSYYETGNGRVNITINSAPFVMENKSYHMGTEKIRTVVENSKGDIETTSVSWFDKVVWLDNGFDDVYDTDTAYSSAKKTDTGSLLGILTARGNFRANYTDMPVAPAEKDYLKADGTLDLDKYKIAQYNYQQEVDKFNNTTGNSIMTKIEAQFDQLIHGIVTMINDILCPNIDSGKFTEDVSGKLKDGSIWTADADNYKILDVNHCPVGTDDDATMGEELFTRNGYERYKVVTLDEQVYSEDYKDEDGNLIGLAKKNDDGTFSLYVYQEEDPNEQYTLYTSQNLVINPNVLENYSLLPVKTNPLQGGTAAYDHAIYDKILTSWQKDFAALDPNTLTTYSYDDYYSEMVGGLATQGMIWKNVLDNQTSLAESVEDKRQQVAGVSSDEELVELLKYQHAYNAASRYINVVDQMLQHLIERLA